MCLKAHNQEVRHGCAQHDVVGVGVWSQMEQGVSWMLKVNKSSYTPISISSFISFLSSMKFTKIDTKLCLLKYNQQNFTHNTTIATKKKKTRN